MPPKKGNKAPQKLAKISATADMRKRSPASTATKRKPAAKKTTTKSQPQKRATTARAPVKRKATVRRRRAAEEDFEDDEPQPSIWSNMLSAAVDYFKSMPLPISGIPMDARQRSQVLGVNNGNPVLTPGEYRAEKGVINPIPGSRESFVRWCWDCIQTGKWDFAKLAGIPLNDVANQIYSFFRTETPVGKTLTNTDAKNLGVLADLRDAANSVTQRIEGQPPQQQQQEQQPNPQNGNPQTFRPDTIAYPGYPTQIPFGQQMPSGRAPFQGIADEDQPMDQETFLAQMRQFAGYN